LKTHTSFPFGIVFLYAFMWDGGAFLICTLISFITLTIWGTFVILSYSIPLFIFFGFVQAIWFGIESERWGSRIDLKRFSVFSGAVFGLLCCLTANIWSKSFVQGFDWNLPWSLIIIGLYVLGGAYSGELNSKKLIPLVNEQQKTDWQNIVAHYSILVFCLFVAILIIYHLKYRNYYSYNVTIHNLLF
jgi:hypothetical protein